MPDTYQGYTLSFTPTGDSSPVLTLNITVDTTVTEKIDTQYSDDSGHPITNVSGSFEGNPITVGAPIGINQFLGNDNLYVAATEPQALDYSGVSFSVTANNVTTDYNLFYEVGGAGDKGWTLDTTDKGNATHVFTGGTLTVTAFALCFASGTRILTTRGEVAVEDLSVGDLAVTASGEERPITWIGSRTTHKPARAQQPVRVMAGAFGENRPARDLFLSPGHAVCVDVMGEVFVPVDQLINGATVAQTEVTEVTYWHVELESHDVLVAEGLGCESYMDAGNRAWFGREYGRLEAIDPVRVAASLTRYARPFMDCGPVVEAIRQQLTSRAETLGWRRNPDIDLHLIVDGQRVEPVIDGDLARFIFPAEAKSATLVSHSFSPSWTGQARDRRELGVMVKAIDISDGLRVERRITPDDAALTSGFHPLERQGEAAHRWTDGHGDLPAELWAGCQDQVVLRLAFAPACGWTWMAPHVPLAVSLVRAA